MFKYQINYKISIFILYLFVDFVLSLQITKQKNYDFNDLVNLTNDIVLDEETIYNTLESNPLSYLNTKSQIEILHQKLKIVDAEENDIYLQQLQEDNEYLMMEEKSFFLQNQRNLQSQTVVTKNIILPCVDEEIGIQVSDLQIYLQNLENLEIFDSYDYVVEQSNDYDCNGNVYDINLLILGGDQKICKLQKINVQSDCVQNLIVDVVDFNQISTLTYSISTQFNQFQSMQINKVFDEIRINNVQIIQNNFDFKGIFNNNKKIIFENCQYKNNIYTGGQGFHVVDIYQSAQEIKFLNCIFDLNQNSKLIKINEGNVVNFIDCSVKGNQNADLEMEIIDIHQVQVINMNNIEVHDNLSKSAISTGIEIQTAQNINIINGSFLNNFGSPALFISLSRNIILQQLTFQENYNEQSNGAGLFIDYSNNIMIQDSQFSENISLNGAGVFLNFNNKVSVFNNTFTQNDVLSIGLGAGGGMFGMNLNNMLINNNTFSDNIAGSTGSAFTIDVSSNIYIDNNEFYNNKASQGGAVLLGQCKNSTIINVIAKYNYASIWGGFLVVLNSQDGINITNSILDSNHARAYGGCFFFGYNAQGTIYLSNSIVNNHTVSTLGGSVLDYFTRLSVYRNVTFSNNMVQLGQAGDVENKLSISTEYNDCQFIDYEGASGGSLFFEIMTGNITMNNCNFRSNNKRDAKYVIMISFVTNLVTFNNIHIEQYEEYEIKYGSIYLIRVDNVIFKDSQFINGYQPNGGFLKAERIQNITIQNTIVKNNIADFNGGAVWAKNVNSILIKNSQFQDNQAINIGGCIYLQGIKSVEILDNSEFINNKVQNLIKTGEAGAIYISGADNFKSQGTLWQNNEAQLYGGAIKVNGVLTTEIVSNNFIENKVYLDKLIKEEDRLGNYILSQGGGLFYGTQNLKMGFFTLYNCSFTGNEASSGAGVLLLEQKGTIINLILGNENSFTNNIADYGSALRYLGVSKNFQTGQSASGNKNLIGGEDFNFDYQLNERRLTEDDSQFGLCPKGTQLVEKGSTTCDACNLHGVCQGGYIFTYNKEFYWRVNKTSNEYFYCDFIPEACQEGDICAPGYQGVLCGSCETKKGYIKSTTGQCQECMNANPALSVTEMSTCIFPSLQNEEELAYKQFQYLRVFDYNLIIMIIFLITYYTCLKMYQSVLKKINRKKGSDMKMYQYRPKYYNITVLITGFIVYLQYSWPGLVKFGLYSLHCLQVDGKGYSQYDPLIECDSEYYRTVMAPVTVVYVVLFAVIAPVVLIFFMFKAYRQKVDNDFQIKYTRVFSSLIMDYKPKYVYWEIISFLYRIALILSTLIFDNNKVIEKSIAILIIMAYIMTLKSYQPIRSFRLNKLEIISNSIVLYTMFVELLYAHEPYNNLEYTDIKEVFAWALNLTHICFLACCLIYLFIEEQDYLKNLIYNYAEQGQNIFIKKIFKKLEKRRGMSIYVLSQWSFLRQAVQSFNKLKQIPNLKKVSNPIIFYNFESDKILSWLLRDNYEFLTTKSDFNRCLDKTKSRQSKLLQPNKKREKSKNNQQQENQIKLDNKKNSYYNMPSIEQRNLIKKRFKNAEQKQINKPKFKNFIEDISKPIQQIQIKDENNENNTSVMQIKKSKKKQKYKSNKQEILYITQDTNLSNINTPALQNRNFFQDQSTLKLGSERQTYSNSQRQMLNNNMLNNNFCGSIENTPEMQPQMPQEQDKQIFYD